MNKKQRELATTRNTAGKVTKAKAAPKPKPKPKLSKGSAGAGSSGEAGAVDAETKKAHLLRFFKK